MAVIKFKYNNYNNYINIRLRVTIKIGQVGKYDTACRTR